jgi:hypothetical protein
MPSYIELDKNVSVPASSDVSKLILSLNSLGQLVVTDNTGGSSFPTFTTASPTYPNIDLSTGNYTISGGGIYEITNASINQLEFPDPINFTGQTITIINSDSGFNAYPVDNSFQPYDRGTGTQLTRFDSSNQYQFVSIGDKWRGGKFS